MTDSWQTSRLAAATSQTLRQEPSSRVRPGSTRITTSNASPHVPRPARRFRPLTLSSPGIRDAALTASTLVSLYDHASSTPSSLASSPPLFAILSAYIALTQRLQHTPNPSGPSLPHSLSGLDEPKFHANGSAFTSSWGRPQRDGPALRALALMAFVRAVNASNPEWWAGERRASRGEGEGDGGRFFDRLYSATMPASSPIKADLEYVSHFWRESGFDLWEEVYGAHFFTAVVQHRALREGAELAAAFGDQGAGEWYARQAGLLRASLHGFWDEERGRLVQTLGSRRSGLDCGILLGALHGNAAVRAGGESDVYPPWSDEVLVSLLQLVEDQRRRFPINAARGPEDEQDVLRGVGIGRYPEDIYDGYGNAPNGGNPWFLCTSSVSEILYHVSDHLSTAKHLNVTDRGLPFWQALLSTSPSYLTVQPSTTYTPADEVFSEAVRRLHEVGDGFLAVVRRHADADGALSEQFDRMTGFERGARDLTWSYGAFLQAVWARRRAANSR